MRRFACGLVLVLAVASGCLADDSSAAKPIKIPGQQPAPEFEAIADWVNSKPLTVAGLKGKVVVVHFMTFG